MGEFKKKKKERKEGDGKKRVTFFTIHINNVRSESASHLG
jgi:hypothetical protein